MGKTPDELQREIADYRSRIESKIDALDYRVRTEVRDTGSDVTSQLKDRVSVSEYADKHPVTTLAGAFGVGVLLGIFTDNKRMSSAAHGVKSAGRRGGSLIEEVMSGAQSTLGISLQDELRDLVRQFTSDGNGGQPRAPEMRTEDEEEAWAYADEESVDDESAGYEDDAPMPYDMHEAARRRAGNASRQM